MDPNTTRPPALNKVLYDQLNGKQKEMYNFHKFGGILADYGFVCIKLSDDWAGADFLAIHKDGTDIRRVQLKPRLYICRKYMNKDLFMAFPTGGRWYLVLRDLLVEEVGKCTNWLNTSSWIDQEFYHSTNPGAALMQFLSEYRVGAG